MRPSGASEALSRVAFGFIENTEISDAGSVPELRVVNCGLQPTLIVDGEELVGAKQNRIVNLTILVPAKAKLTIPVSCVEAGRWNARSRAFAAAPRTQYATGRAKRMAQVSDAIRDHGGALRADVVRWSFVFWLGQVVAMTAIMSALLR